jgi:hypothetical protein
MDAVYQIIFLLSFLGLLLSPFVCVASRMHAPFVL